MMRVVATEVIGLSLATGQADCFVRRTDERKHVVVAMKASPDR
jgi:hypothetical protein